jgi:hypothetical protein
MHLRAIAAVLALVVAACSRAPPGPAAAPAHAAGLGVPAWERMKRVLPGSWSMPSSKGGTFVVSYKLISAGTVLVEEWGAGTPSETETVFHPDHGDLVLTHYCAQGDQPRLRVAEVSGDALVFRFVDITNRGPDQSMLVERTLRFADDSFEDTEVYQAPDGTRETTTNRFTRVRGE